MISAGNVRRRRRVGRLPTAPPLTRQKAEADGRTVPRHAPQRQRCHPRTAEIEGVPSGARARWAVHDALGPSPEHVMGQADLIYDVGMCRGEDSGFYLKLGYRVVGFEADPMLAEKCRRRFSDAISSGRLQIVEGAICDEAPPSGVVTFYANDANHEWGTVNSAWAARNLALGAPSRAVEVKALDFRECLETYGVPQYMKIDIEGADLACVKALQSICPSPADLPIYLSLESNKTDFDVLVGELKLLSSMGYKRFAAVQQQTVGRRKFRGRSVAGQPVDHVFPPGASGPFGPDIDAAYLPIDEAIAKYRRIFWMYEVFGDGSPLIRRSSTKRLLGVAAKLSRTLLGRPLPGWYDTHAAVG
jgi:FkbM family methyltransferase